MSDWWVSWYSTSPMDEFELHSPWWVTGYTMDEPQANIIVAAVRAPEAAAAYAQVRAAYDNGPEGFRERFVEPLTRSPFTDRFPQAAWMRWDAERTCGCSVHGGAR